MVHKHKILDLLDIMCMKRSVNAGDDDFYVLHFILLCFLQWKKLMT